MSRVAQKVLYEGRVQGVGFRFTVRQIAKGFDVNGSISNLPDGRVELCVGGEVEEVKEFLLAIRESGLAGHIAREYVENLSPDTRWKGFSIIRE